MSADKSKKDKSQKDKSQKQNLSNSTTKKNITAQSQAHKPKPSKPKIPPVKLSKARLAALEVIVDMAKHKCFVRPALDRIIRQHQLSREDRKFATKLSLGVVQTLWTLDSELYKCVDKKSDIKGNVLNALRISAYELLYLEKEPHAAVDQGVELVGTIEPRARGLANFVLHKIVRHKRKFPYGNPDTDDEAFCRIYAMPLWIFDMFKFNLGEDKARFITSSSNGQAPCYIFVNTLKASVEEIVAMLKECGAEPKKTESLCGIYLQNCFLIKNPSALRFGEAKHAIQSGKIVISDAAAQGVCEYAFMHYNQGEVPDSMLEVCAGNGTKTIMLQALSQQRGGKQIHMTTLDNVEAKTSELFKRTRVAGASVDLALTGDATKMNSMHLGQYNHVFVDAPCSGLGTLRRHPEIKWRLKPSTVQNLSRQSLGLLTAASKHVKFGGFLTYSTCTVTNLECKDVVNEFLASKEGQNFVLCRYAFNGRARDYYNSQTIGGMNDYHFAAQLKLVR